MHAPAEEVVEEPPQKKRRTGKRAGRKHKKRKRGQPGQDETEADSTEDFWCLPRQLCSFF